MGTCFDPRWSSFWRQRSIRCKCLYYSLIDLSYSNTVELGWYGHQGDMPSYPYYLDVRIKPGLRKIVTDTYCIDTKTKADQEGIAKSKKAKKWNLCSLEHGSFIKWLQYKGGSTRGVNHKTKDGIMKIKHVTLLCNCINTQKFDFDIIFKNKVQLAHGCDQENTQCADNQCP